jgi:hypothetical protein
MIGSGTHIGWIAGFGVSLGLGLADSRWYLLIAAAMAGAIGFQVWRGSRKAGRR